MQPLGCAASGEPQWAPLLRFFRLTKQPDRITVRQRARFRQNSHEAKLITTRSPLRYDFSQFTFTSRMITKGSRLRLVIGPIDSINSQKNYNAGGDVSAESIRDARAVTVTLYHDKAHPSALYVPIGQRE